MGTEAGYILATVYNIVLDMNMQEFLSCADLESLMNIYTGVVYLFYIVPNFSVFPLQKI